MPNQESLAPIAKRLDAEPRLQGAFSAEPQLLWMPDPKTPGKRSLFVGLFVAESMLDRGSLASVCTRTLETLNSGSGLAGVEAVELMLCVARGGTAERVLRMTVQASALHNAELLTAADLEQKQPMDGVTCALYRRSLT